MTPIPEPQARPILVKITPKGRGGMLLTDTYVVSRPVTFDVVPGAAPPSPAPAGTSRASAPGPSA